MLIEKQNRVRDKKHRMWIASLPCIVSGYEGMCQAAHVSEGRHSIGLKACDSMCIPLCVFEHQTQHEQGERQYWLRYGGIERVKTLANALYKASQDTAEAIYLIEQWRKECLTA